MTFHKWYMIRNKNEFGQKIFKDFNLEYELQIYGVNISSWKAFISFFKRTSAHLKNYVLKFVKIVTFKGVL